MVVHQLDLFGGPLKPPKKIKVDDYDLPAYEPQPVEEPINVPVDEAVPALENDFAEVSGEPDADIGNATTNDIEWAPEASNEADTSSAVEVAGEDVIDEIHYATTDEANASIETGQEQTFHNDEVEITHAIPAEQETEEPAFTNEAIFTPPVTVTDDAPQEVAESVLADELTEDDTLAEEIRLDDEAKVLHEPPNEVIETTTITESFAEAAPGRRGKIDHEENNDGLNVPPDEELFKRQYYSMRETSAMFGVNQSLLRFWENEFAILQPKKNKKGDRYFRPVDIKNLVLIYHLLRVRKFTMDGAKDYLQSHKKAGDTFELIKRLEKLKSFLFELKAGL
ncbi:hypothetical protein BH10BAC3_BH10BAC3_37970 [soil metagenome]